MNYILENNFTKNYFIMDGKFHNIDENINKNNNKLIKNPNYREDFLKNNLKQMKNNNDNNIDLKINDNNSNNLNKNLNYYENNNDNIFGLNFHQDEEDENEIVNSLHFSKFKNKNSNINDNLIIKNNLNYNSKENNYEQKVKNNRNIIANNMKNSLMDDEPYQISVSKYTESNIENQSIFNNSKMNKNYSNNNNKKIDIKKIKNNNIINENELEYYSKEYKFNDKNLQFKDIPQNNYNKKINFERNQAKIYNKNKVNKKLFEEQNNLKNNLLLNHNMNNICTTKNKIIPNIIKHNKSFSSNRNLLNNNYISENNRFTENNYYQIDKNKNIKKNINNYPYNTENGCNKIYYNNSKKNISSNRIHNINIRNIPKINSNDNNFLLNEVNFKKIYSKRQKAELDMVRGCFIYDKKLFNFDLKNSNSINYIKFIKPTEPIIQINYRNVDKFYPLIRKYFTNELYTNFDNSNYNIFKNSNNPQKYQDFVDKNNIHNLIYNKQNINNNNKIMLNDKIPIPKNNFKINENEQINKNILDNFVRKENNENKSNKTDKDGLTFQLKKKIYDWLVDINIIKDKIIKMDSLPTLCINGVLLCDLINRCEGKNEILKGIIRRTSTRSQIQVNINKVLEYLRSKEKFPSRHLWNNLEISRGNSLIIWQLLDDIYNFYGNKIFFKRRLNRNLSQNLNKTFTKENNKISNKEEIKNSSLNTPLRQRKMKTINVNKNNNFNGNNQNDFYIKNNNNYSKYSYTPNIHKNRKNKIADNFYNNKNKNIENNNNIYNINKKFSKNEKKNINIHNINNLEFNYKVTDSSNRNNLNHTNDNFYESKMFSIDNSNDIVNIKDNKSKKRNIDNTYRNNFDISSIYSDRFINAEKNNKSFSVNNGFYNKKRKNIMNNGNYSRYNINSNNQSFYSTNIENRSKSKGCFLLFEKASINKLKEKIGALNKYNTNDIETLDIKDI